MRESEFVALMATMQALLALAIDIMLPALGVIASDLGANDPNERQLVIGAYLIAGGVGSLFPGILADRFGRRPLLLSCLGCYFALSLACALVHDFTALLVLRAVQGFLTAGLFVLPLAIIRDRFSGDRMARAQSLIAMVFMVVPMFAPMLGQAVLHVAGWRMIFGVMAAVAGVAGIWVWLRLPETLRPEYRQEIQPRAILGNMRVAVMHRMAAGYFLGAALIQGSFLAYLNSSQQLIAEHFEAADAFPFIFGGMALVMSFANFTNSRIVERFGARRVAQTAVFVYIANSALMLWFAASGHLGLWGFVPLMTVTMCLLGFINANFQSIALQPFGRIAGAAASVQACFRMILGAILGAVIGQAYNGSAVPLAAGLLMAALGAIVLVLLAEQGKLFRRFNYPDTIQERL